MHVIGATENARPDIARPSKLWGLTSRDMTTRHQIKSGVSARFNPTFWTISELNPVCHDSTAALTITCSSACSQQFCRRSYGVPTAAGRQQQQQQRGRRRGQSGARASSDNFEGVGIGNGSSCINFWLLLRIVHLGATCWLRNGAVRTCAVLPCVCQLWMGMSCLSFGY